MTYNVAIIGVLSLVGHEILNILAETEFPIGKLYPLTTKKMSGREMSFGDRDVITHNMDDFDYSKADIVFVAGQDREAKSIIQKSLKANAKVIDCTGASLFDEAHDNLKSLPTSASAQLLSILTPLHESAKIKRVVVSTYEAVSVEGKDGMDELFNQSRKFFVSDAPENNFFDKQISFNVIPQIGDVMDDGQTNAEWRLSAEIKKCLDKEITVTATSVAVPIFIGTGMAVNVEFNSDIDAKMARQIWRDNDDTVVIDAGSEMEYVTPAEIAGEDSVFISRVRNDSTVNSGISFWCAADNIRACMAVRAVRAAQNFIVA